MTDNAPVDGLSEGSSAHRAAPSRGWQGLRLLVSLAFSGVSLALVLRDVDWSRLVVTLIGANVILLLLAMVGVVANSISKAARWRMLFAEEKLPPIGRSFSVLSIGFLMNTLAPTRIGELARVYLISESESVSKAYVLGTIAIEKIVELAVALVSVALLVTQMALPEWLIKPTQVALLSVVAIVPFILSAWKEDWVLRGVRFFGRFAPRLSTEWLVVQIQQSLASFRTLGRRHVLRGFLAWTISAWVLGITTNYLVLVAIGLSLPIWAPLLVLVVTQIGGAVIPSAPGQVGVFHYLAVLSLSVFGIEKEVALGYGVLLHLVAYMPMMLIGAYCLGHEKVTWRRLLDVIVHVERQVSRQDR